LLFFGILVYMLWAFRKVFVEFQDLRVGLWGIVLQFTSDFAVTAGFFKGLLAKNLCSIHYELVNKDSTLGRNLGVLGIDLDIKPLICRLHPYFFSKESNGFMKWIDCYETIYAVIENNDKISVDNVKKNALFEAIVKKRSLDKMIIAKQLNDFELKDFLNQKVVIK